MKAFTRSILAALLGTCALRADVYSKSYLVLRPRFEINLPERLALFRDRMDVRENGVGGAFEVAGFYGQTANSAAIARYFLPNHKDYIRVGEDASDCAMTRKCDVNAYNLGILTAPIAADSAIDGYKKLTFESVVNLCPEQIVAGVGFAYQYRLPSRFWCDIAAPVIQIRNRLGITEDIHNKGGKGHPEVPAGFFGDALSALGDCNTDRKYGRLTSRTLKKTRLAFIEARVGRDIYTAGDYILGGFIGGIIPTGNKPCARYLFEPIVGVNNWGIMIGSYGIFELMRDMDGATFNGLYNLVTRLWAANNQLRSFDLRGKPWSRYMKVYKGENGGRGMSFADIPRNLDYLINYSTLCTCVRPYASLDVTAGVNYKNKNFNVECGYNAYARKAEEALFTHSFGTDIGLPALAFNYANSPDGQPATDSKATISTSLFKQNNPAYSDQVINQNGLNDTAAYVPLTLDDLDPDSGAQPACFSQMIYGSLGYAWNNIKYPTIINGGVSYEFAYDNTFTRRWVAWFKVGVSV
jgi:hypothetical protein